MKISEIESHMFEYILNEILKPVILTGLVGLVLMKSFNGENFIIHYDF